MQTRIEYKALNTTFVVNTTSSLSDNVAEECVLV